MEVFNLWTFIGSLIIVSGTTSFIAVMYIAYKDNRKNKKNKERQYADY